MFRSTSIAVAALSASVFLSLAGCNRTPEAPAAPAAATPTGKVDLARLQAVATEPGAWLTSGRDAGKTHYSPLDLINQENVSRLGFAWQLETGTVRGMEATPIVVDGVMYTSGVAGRVYALDARDGKVLWRFEPQVDLRNARSACCDLVNRGVAVWQGKVYVGTFDGMLYALDATDGKVLWKVDTIEDHKRAYSVTGAPQVAGKVVVIGNGGAEFDSRGYVTAYDLETGKQVWRFHTVPGGPSEPNESKAMEIAAPTWTRQRCETRRWRQRLGRHELRPGTEPGVFRHGQRRAVEPHQPQSGWWRQSFPRRRSLHCMPTRANTHGITRRRRASAGTTTPRRS